MRLAFFLLVLANLLFFSWDSGYFGGQEEGREPQRLKDQIQPEKMKVVVQEKTVPTTPQPACRLIDKLTASDAEQLQKTMHEAGSDFAATIKTIDEASSFWVNIPALPNKAFADKKAGELKLLGVTDFHIMQAEGGFAISLGLFRNESSATEFLQGLNKKGVKSARIEVRNKQPALVRLEVRGAADLLAKRLPDLLAARGRGDGRRLSMTGFVVGLTGGIGSGKSAAAQLFAEQGAAIIDTDAIAHELTGRGGVAMPAIRAAFGASAVAADGSLDRTAMRQLVFADAAARERLEAILHPLIGAEAGRRCDVALAAGAPYVVLVVPLLVESGHYRQRVARIAVVDCAEETQFARVMARSGLVRAEVARIMAAQASRHDRCAAADDLIDNDGNLADLRRQVEKLHRRYREMATMSSAS